MKIDPAILVKDNQIYNKNGEAINLRAYTVDNFAPKSKGVTKLDVSDLESSFDAIKKRGCQIIRWVVYWNSIEPTEGSYNEEYLAGLREYIKKAEQSNLLVYIVPKVSFNNEPSWTKNSYSETKMIDGESAGLYYVHCFTDAMNHLARRIKDCKNVVGFALPGCFEELLNTSCVAANTQQELSMSFMKVLHKKHTQYYFIKEEACKNNVGNLKDADKTEYTIISGVFLANNQVMLIC